MLKPEQPKKKPLNEYARWSALGFQLMVLALLGVWTGDWLDKILATSKPICTALSTLLFLGLGFYQLFRSIKK